MWATRKALGMSAVAIATLFAGCGDDPPTAPVVDNGATLSDPALMFASAPAAADGRPAVSVPSGVAYVSLAPSLAPEGVSAVIRIRGTPFAITELLLDGGLDPVPVPANVGDTVDLVVTDRAGATTRTVNVVPATRKPKVVRTVPPKGKTDVPLNSAVKVVFSEPMDARSLTPGAITLRQGNTVVAGSLTLDAQRLTVAFVPDAQLLPNAGYRLTVSGTVRDLDGDALDGSVTVDFISGTQVEETGRVASVTVAPNPAAAIPGQSILFTAVTRDASGHVLSDRIVTWESSNTEVARVLVPGGDTIAINGLIEATGVGKATITATSEGISGSGEMTVLPATEGLGTVVSVTVVLQSSGLEVDDTGELLVTPRDVNGREMGDGWAAPIFLTSSNPSVASVPAVQNPGCSPLPCWTPHWNYIPITGTGEGITVITATINGVSGSTVVVVGPRRVVTSVTINPGSAMLLPGVPYTLYLRITLSDATGTEIAARQVSWSVDNPAVVTVAPVASSSALAKITVVGTGSTLVRATSEGVSGTATITVPLLTFTSVSAGDHDPRYYSDDYMGGHTCGVTLAGSTFCWGGDRGTPGDQVYYYWEFPLLLGGGLGLSSVTAGGSHTCGLTAVGAAHCWGDQIDTYWTFRPDSIDKPVAVPGGQSFVSVDAGGWHTCGLTATGHAYCWGSDEFGQLGDGSSGSINIEVPVAVSGEHNFVAITAGRGHSCGLTAGGAAYCWGLNDSAQLGDGTTTTRLAPVAVAGGHVFIAITAGLSHSCALTASGAAYCWGANSRGELGDGSTSSRTLPTPVSGGLNFVTLSAGVGGATTCGLTAAGSAYCWGANSHGQLGDGTTVNRSAPVAVAGGLSFSSVSAGGTHTCGVTTMARIYCWGAGGAGQLGNGMLSDSAVPVKVAGQP